jgi:methyl-accepting chemotaxis protein
VAVNEIANGNQDLIGEIIRVVEGVAFQTIILALNAAVEAVRAGEQGRGFAVVASVVRALALRTTGAAKEIRQLIAESADRVASGGAQTQRAQGRMQQVLDSVSQVSALLGEVSSATHEQQTGLSQVNSAVADMDGITQQNAAMVEELAATAYSRVRSPASRRRSTCSACVPATGRWLKSTRSTCAGKPRGFEPRGVCRPVLSDRITRHEQ